MTLLEAAKKLAATDPQDSEWAVCCYCNQHPHEPDCPWLALPKIIAALEAAQALKGAVKHQRFNQPNDWLIERLAALQEALKG